MPDRVGQIDHLTLEDRPQSPLPPAVVRDEPHQGAGAYARSSAIPGREAGNFHAADAARRNHARRRRSGPAVRAWRTTIDMRPDVRTAILIILGAAFASFLLSVALWFGVFGDPDRQAGIFVGLWVPSILGLGAVLTPRGGSGR